MLLWRCWQCALQGDGKNARRDHATGIGFLLHDLCGAEGALVARGHSLDTMIHEINHMVKILPDDCGRLWEVDGKSLCFCFVCPCCSQVRSLARGDEMEGGVRGREGSGHWRICVRLSEGTGPLHITVQPISLPAPLHSP